MHCPVGSRAVYVTVLILVLSAGDWMCAATGSSEAQGHPVGLSKTPEARLVIRDVSLTSPEPMVLGERGVLTTIGIHGRRTLPD